MSVEAGRGSPAQKSIIIRADMREVRSRVPELIDQSGIARTELVSLSAGDYQLADSVIAERKSAHDFVISIMDRRLFEQVAKIKEEVERCLLIVEGDIFATRSKIHPNALIGAQSWLALEGVSVVPSKDVRTTAMLLSTLARHAQQGLGYEIALRANKPKEIAATQQFLVEGLPGVGPAAAQDLLAHFGSPAALFGADEAALCGCAGIGRKTAQRIIEALRAPWTGRQIPGVAGRRNGGNGR